MSEPRKPRASVFVTVESDENCKLIVKRVFVIDGEPDVGDLVFKWFVQTGNTIQDAHKNCFGSIAFYLRCRPDLRGSILNVLEPEAAREVRARLGIASEEEQEASRSRR